MQRLLGSKLASHLPSICCSSSQEFLNHTYLRRLNPWSYKETLEVLLFIMMSSFVIPLTNHYLNSIGDGLNSYGFQFVRFSLMYLTMIINFLLLILTAY